MVELLGERFTLVGPEHPVGAFFEALYRTGLYWQFLGLAQVVAGVLLLVPRLAHLGAALFLPIILNVFVITVSLSFGATSVVTGLMLLAVAYLCVWDLHRFRALFTLEPPSEPVPVPRLDRWEAAGFAVFGVSLVTLFGMTRDLVGGELALAFLVTGLLAGLATLARFLWVWWHRLRAPAAG